MKMSLMSVRICEQRFGKGRLHGFEQMGEITPDTLSEDELNRVTNELADSDWIVLHEDGVHISALGQHNLNMMIAPDVFFELDNSVLQTNVKIYIKNAYYLCVVDHKKTSAAGDSDVLFIELLPSLKAVVGLFVYALYREGANEKAEAKTSDDKDRSDIQITAQAWNRKSNAATELEWCADYCGSNTLRMVTENRAKQADDSSDVSDLVNQLTMWMFDRLSENMENEVVVKEEK